MPRRGIIFKKGSVFHIISRAVEEREIFKKVEDCYRFIFQIYAANVGRPASNLHRQDIIKAGKAILSGGNIPQKFIVVEHQPLVGIFDFSLVVNHYHLLLVSNVENGVPLFMMKLNGGFAMFFNLKYGRMGSLFGSRYKSIPIKTNLQSHATSRYVSIVNPLDVYQPGWREDGLNNSSRAFTFLQNFEFSSFPDKIGNRKSKVLAPPKVFKKYGLDIHPRNKDYREFVQDFLKGRLSSFRAHLTE